MSSYVLADRGEEPRQLETAFLLSLTQLKNCVKQNFEIAFGKYRTPS